MCEALSLAIAAARGDPLPPFVVGDEERRNRENHEDGEKELHIRHRRLHHKADDDSRGDRSKKSLDFSHGNAIAWVAVRFAPGARGAFLGKKMYGLFESMKDVLSEKRDEPQILWLRPASRDFASG